MTQALNLNSCRPHKRIAFFPIYYTGHSEAASSSLADYDVAHKKLHWTESINARKHSVSGNKAMMHATCSEITFSIWQHNKWKVVCMQATVMDTGSAFRRERLLNSSRTHRQGSAGVSISHICPAASVAMAMQVNCTSERWNKLDRCAQEPQLRQATSSKKCWTLPNVLPRSHKTWHTEQWPILKLSFFSSYFPCVQQIDSGCTFQ